MARSASDWVHPSPDLFTPSRCYLSLPWHESPRRAWIVAEDHQRPVHDTGDVSSNVPWRSSLVPLSEQLAGPRSPNFVWQLTNPLVSKLLSNVPAVTLLQWPWSNIHWIPCKSLLKFIQVHRWSRFSLKVGWQSNFMSIFLQFLYNSWARSFNQTYTPILPLQTYCIDLGQNLHGWRNTRFQCQLNHTDFRVSHMGVLVAFSQISPICSTLPEIPPI
jgi:hypothetical protein